MTVPRTSCLLDKNIELVEFELEILKHYKTELSTFILKYKTHIDSLVCTFIFKCKYIQIWNWALSQEVKGELVKRGGEQVASLPGR